MISWTWNNITLSRKVGLNHWNLGQVWIDIGILETAASPAAKPNGFDAK